jgi:hypothetical protein
MVAHEKFWQGPSTAPHSLKAERSTAFQSIHSQAMIIEAIIFALSNEPVLARGCICFIVEFIQGLDSAVAISRFFDKVSPTSSPSQPTILYAL